MFDEPSKQRVKELCDQIAKEQAHPRFSMLVAGLNQLLEELDPRGNRSSVNTGEDESSVSSES
jgi:hypothetical protein